MSKITSLCNPLALLTLAMLSVGVSTANAQMVVSRTTAPTTNILNTVDNLHPDAATQEAINNLLTAGGDPDFRDIDELVSADISVFQKLFQQAKNETVTIAMFGDSQETAPIGGGLNYVPAFNFELNRRYGNTPVSGTAFALSQASRWLLAGAANRLDQTFSGNTDPSLLPSQRIGVFNNSPSAGGLLAQLNLDAGSTTPLFNGPNLEFDGRRVRVELTVRDSIGSGEVYWRANVQDGDIRNFFGGEDIASGTTNLGLGSADGVYVTVDLGVIEIPDDHNAIQLIARGADANGVQIAGIRFYNEDNPVGMAMESFSAGGYRLNDLQLRHGGAADAFRAIADHDIIALHYGANDGVSRSAARYRDDLLALIELLRDWSGDESKPIIIFQDPDFTNIDSAEQREQYDQYPVVAASIALSEQNILAVNSRLLAHEIGWREDGSISQFVADGVHYTVLGARRLAELEVEALFGTLARDIPPGDFDGDFDVDLDDLDRYNQNIGAAAVGALADLDLDGNGIVEANDFTRHYEELVMTSNGQAGTFAGDFNLDGRVTVLGDAFSLVTNLGSVASSWSQGDVTGDGVVDIVQDAFALVANLGMSNTE